MDIIPCLVPRIKRLTCTHHTHIHVHHLLMLTLPDDVSTKIVLFFKATLFQACQQEGRDPPVCTRELNTGMEKRCD